MHVNTTRRHAIFVQDVLVAGDWNARHGAALLFNDVALFYTRNSHISTFSENKSMHSFISM